MFWILRTLSQIKPFLINVKKMGRKQNYLYKNNAICYAIEIKTNKSLVVFFASERKLETFQRIFCRCFHGNGNRILICAFSPTCRFSPENFFYKVHEYKVGQNKKLVIDCQRSHYISALFGSTSFQCKKRTRMFCGYDNQLSELFLQT